MQTAKKRKLPPGLIWRGETIHIDTKVGGRQVRQSTRTSKIKEAQEVLDDMRLNARHRILTGEPADLNKTWAEAIMRYFDETSTKDVEEAKRKLNYMKKFIPLEMAINDIYNSTLDPLRVEMKSKRRKATTLNSYIKLVRQIMNKCVEWEEGGNSWLKVARKFVVESITKNPKPWMNKKDGYSLSWEEQDRLFSGLHSLLKDASLYSVNTGARQSEIANLRWSWEMRSTEMGINIFRIPGEFHKNGKPKIVVLNSIAKAIIEKRRGLHPEFVFTYRDEPIKRFNASAWSSNRDRVNLSHVTFHHLRHTFATRLAGYGVSEVEIAILLGHTIPGVTATYAFTTQSIEPMVANVEKLVERKAMTFVSAGEIRDTQKTHKIFDFVRQPNV
jgi:integrase